MVGQPKDSGEVFISYSWDSEEHVHAVLELSNRLRSEGVDCVLDQYEESPPEGWPRWMDRKICEARLVLVVCTEPYYNRVMGKEVADKGLGVKWEGGLIYQHLYNAGASNTKFIPVLLRPEDRKFIPTPLQGATYYSVDSTVGYDRLYSRLLDKQRVEKPKLGKRRPLPKREVKTDVSMYVSMPIDPQLWDEAKWRGTFVLIYEKGPPALGLGFLNESAARKIFEQWHRRYGASDTFEELRVSIVEGDVKGEPPGYTVHVGADIENTIRRYREAGLTVRGTDAFMTVSRINRMNPRPGSKYIEMFKQAYRLHKTYLLIPVVMKPDGSEPRPILDLGIHKNAVHFRRVEEIGPYDEDAAVLGSGRVKRPFTRFGKRGKGTTKKQ
jgi:hypothetical protein